MIVGFIGLIGNGKTMLATRHAHELARRRNATVLSNILLTIPGVDCRQLPTGEDGIDLGALRLVMDEVRGEGRGVVLLLDEIGILMPARAWASFPVDLMWLFSQSRKNRIDVIYTAQDIEDVDSFIRRKSQWSYKVRAFPTPSIAKQETGRRPWFFYVTQWRPATVDKKDKRLGRSLVLYRRKVEGWYDTDEIVAPAARLRGGRRSRRDTAPLAAVTEPASTGPDGSRAETAAAAP